MAIQSLETVEDCIAMAKQLKQAKAYDEAIPVCQQAITLNPNNEIVYQLLGDCQFELQQYDPARQCFLDALSLKPNSIYIQFRLGRIAHLQKRWQDAADFYKSVIALDPNHFRAYQYLGDVQFGHWFRRMGFLKHLTSLG